jgi:hypothetical protein
MCRLIDRPHKYSREEYLENSESEHFETTVPDEFESFLILRAGLNCDISAIQQTH